MPDEPNRSPQEQAESVVHRNYSQKAYEQTAKAFVWIKSHLPLTPSNHVHADNECSYRLEYAKYIVEIGTLIGLVAYVVINGRILGAMLVANRNAINTLHVSERAYITMDAPQFDTDTDCATVPMDNIGRIPSEPVETIFHEATVDLPVPNAVPDITRANEYHWSSSWHGPVPPGHNLVATIVPAPNVIASKLVTPQGAGQVILIAGWIVYGDGFPDDGQQRSFFCFQTVYQMRVKKVFWVDCDPTRVLHQMEALDGYPNNETKN